MNPNFFEEMSKFGQTAYAPVAEFQSISAQLISGLTQKQVEVSQQLFKTTSEQCQKWAKKTAAMEASVMPANLALELSSQSLAQTQKVCELLTQGLEDYQKWLNKYSKTAVANHSK